MSTLAEELAAEQRITSCLVCRWLLTQSDEAQQEWHAELRKPANIVSHEAVVRILRKRGTSITRSSVERHRRNHEWA